MPELVNKNDHGVRVTDDNGREHRMRAGQVSTYDGALADKFSRISGVESASKEDKANWDLLRTASRKTSTDAGKQSMDQAMVQARVAGRLVSVALPLNQVIGDNDAPIGPPTGTITTKQAVAELGPAEKRAYADHERLPEEAEDEGLSEVERKQAEAKRKLADLHGDVLQQASDGGNEAVTLSPESTGTLATGGTKPKRTGGRKAKSEQSE